MTLHQSIRLNGPSFDAFARWAPRGRNLGTIKAVTFVCGSMARDSCHARRRLILVARIYGKLSRQTPKKALSNQSVGRFFFQNQDVRS